MTFFTKVSGVTMNSQGKQSFQSQGQVLIRKLTKGDSLKLQIEPDNPYDKYAVSVVTQNDEKIGYIPAYIAKKISLNIQKGKEYVVKVADITGGGVNYYGLNIEVTV